MNLENILKQYGLTEKQAKVYLACLELGSASVQKISQKAQLARSTCYEVLTGLQRQRFITTFQKKKAKYFTAEDPKKVIQFARENIERLVQALPEFNALYGEARIRPTVRFYQGQESMKLILNEILDEAKELMAFNSAVDLFNIIPDFQKFVDKRVKRKIPTRVILRESEKARERQRLGPEQLRAVRIIPNSYKFHGLIFIWKNKIAYFSFKKDLVALVIESDILAQTQAAMFEALWDIVEE
ncbi:hypothetical protein KKF61_05610 [Patescibacteria group bacterium]|nr:hypothetical protein [Patescibacteria group bacterium]